MKNLKAFCFFTFLIIAVSCKKDDPNPDYASIIAGIYTGTVTYTGVASVPGSSKLTKSSETKVDLIITIESNTIPLEGIKVSSSSVNVYDLSFTDSSGSFIGTVHGNKLDWTLTADPYEIVFSGTR